MPANYTHYVFGNAVLNVLDAPVKQMITDHLQSFFTGLHGPDLFFYHHPFSKQSLRTYGSFLHDQPAAPFFLHGAEIVRQTKNDVILCYLFGFICHFVLDSACHGYINAYEKQHGVSHAKIEAELDRCFMDQTGADFHTTNSAAHIRKSESLAEQIAPLFENVRPAQLTQAMDSMHRLSGLLVPSSKAKTALFSGLLSIHPKTRFVRDMIPSNTPSRKCRMSTHHLQNVYEQSVPKAAAMCLAFLDTVQNNTPLPNLFFYNYESELKKGEPV